MYADTWNHENQVHLNAHTSFPVSVAEKKEVGERTTRSVW